MVNVLFRSTKLVRYEAGREVVEKYHHVLGAMPPLRLLPGRLLRVSWLFLRARWLPNLIEYVH